MSWQKYHQVVNPIKRSKMALERSRDQSSGQGSTSGHMSSILPEVYSGHPQRISRYAEYDQMNVDSDINRALDIIAEFCTNDNGDMSGEKFDLTYNGDPEDTEVEILNNCLRQWMSINDFKKRLWGIFRNVLMYGDQFFIRDPETKYWHWVSHASVDRILVNEANNKKPEAYMFKDLPEFLAIATQSEKSLQADIGGTASYKSGAQMGRVGGGEPGSLHVVDADHVIHLSLSQGLDANWPFGSSILESVFKPYKQKNMLEEAILIYRIQRAPERRVFYVDVGEMPIHKTGAYLERVKNEIQQTRMPARNGNGTNSIDAAYNPVSMLEDLFFAQSAEGRGSRVDVLPGGDNLGQIDDLKHWQNTLFRALRVPTSYLPTGPEDGGAAYTDGRTGTAYIQEFQFAQYCRRLQNLVSSEFDNEFKLFVKQRGFNVASSMYDLNFQIPQHFSEFARAERQSALINVFKPLDEVPYFSKRFLMEHFLGLSKDDIVKNEIMYGQEHPDLMPSESSGGGSTADIPGLESMGIRPEADLGDESTEGGEPSAPEPDVADDTGSVISGDEADSEGNA